ncbi:hypothetical protein [Saccharicrinis sp. FJH54]|uniref:hypothetical protein n=1 Tax=Saccharicrinis sp. FJH54 TaxID=3344665 RepID=UPI0035D4AF3C
MILFTILILIIFFSAKRVEWIANWYKKIITEPYNYYALLILLVIGFFGHLDYTDRWGCIVGGESIFDTKNILFSSISVTLILISFFLRLRILKVSLVLVELAFWIFKLFYFKGGYVVSIAAAPDPIISFYDSLTLALRLFIITGLIRTNIKSIYIIICTLTIMAIKVFGFPTQLSMIVEGEKSKQRAEITKKKLIGDWTGIYEYDSTYMGKTTHIVDSATIRFDSLFITIYDFQEIDSLQLKMEFDYEFGGHFHNGIKNDWRNQYDFWIRNLTSDSLDIILTQSLDDYFFKLIKTPPNTRS